jgi:hypothetical protein
LHEYKRRRRGLDFGSSGDGFGTELADEGRRAASGLAFTEPAIYEIRPRLGESPNEGIEPLIGCDSEQAVEQANGRVSVSGGKVSGGESNQHLCFGTIVPSMALLKEE